jgi:hypothetical protein
VLKLEIDARRMQRYLLALELWSGALVYSFGLYLIWQGGLYGAAVTSAIVSGTGLVFFGPAVLRVRWSTALVYPGSSST